MMNEIMYLSLPDYLTNLEKKGYNRELLEEIAIESGGKYVSVNDSERKKNVLKHIGWTLGCATMTGLGSYFFTEIFLDSYSRVGEVTGIFAAIGAVGMFDSYRNISENADNKAKIGVDNYLKKDL